MREANSRRNERRKREGSTKGGKHKHRKGKGRKEEDEGKERGRTFRNPGSFECGEGKGVKGEFGKVREGSKRKGKGGTEQDTGRREKHWLKAEYHLRSTIQVHRYWINSTNSQFGKVAIPIM